MPDFGKAKIYVLRRRDTNAIFYCGSTCTSLSLRLKEHKKASKKRNYPVYRYMRENEIVPTIELIENFPCNCKEELHKREGYHIKILRKSWVLQNYSIAGRSKLEYIKDNLESHLARKRSWHFKKKALEYKPVVRPTWVINITFKTV
jgi:hypothetical protein